MMCEQKNKIKQKTVLSSNDITDRIVTVQGDEYAEMEHETTGLSADFQSY